MDRPDFIKCIVHTHAERKNQTWCGRMREPWEWAFLDIDHAAYSRLAEDRLLPCPECVAAVTRLLAKE